MVTSRIARRHDRRRFVVFAAGTLIAATQLAPVVAASTRPVSAPASARTALVNPTSTIHLDVVAARTEPRANGGTGVTKGQKVTTFKWMINIDNTGTTTQRNPNPGSGCSPLDANYPDSCDWASIAGLASSAPVYAQGDETTFPAGGLTLPNGRYLVSVLADGFKLDGTPFTIPMESPGTVEVPLQPWPLPTSTIKAQVFADVTEANGQYDPGEDGLPNFRGIPTDYLGQVNTDVFGNPLCTVYDYTDTNGNGVQDGQEQITLSAPDYEPTVVRLGGKCLSGDINMDGVVNGTDESLYVSLGLDPSLARGELTIPNLGTNRYALSVAPPTGTEQKLPAWPAWLMGKNWVQTTTLEGNHDWDWWAMEGSTGYDTEFVQGAEPFPAAIFGFLPAPSSSYWNDPAHKFQAGGHGTIKGLVDAMDVYIPQKGGLNLPTVEIQGAKVDHPIDKPWISLSDLNRGDTAVYLGRGNADGTFQINNVPDGTYTLTYWDEPQDYILDLMTVTVANGEVIDAGIMPLFGWWAKFSGTVFNDLNRNGKRDAGEPGVPNFGLTLRGRENNLMDRGSKAVSTDSNGRYSFDQAYPLTEWIILEAYDDRYYTTGVTYQADNQPNETTVLGAGVDVSVLPIIGLDGRLDWGVHFYDATGTNGVDPQNGGIVGSISYDTTRNELDPQYAAAEDWQPGVSGITVELWSPVDCGTDANVPCDANGDYELNTDGSYKQGKLLNTYVSETWERPTDCVARDVGGNPLAYPADQQVLPIGSGKGCVEGPLMGIQFGPYPTDQGTPDANFGAAVDGNFGFGDGCFGAGVLDASDPSAPECVGGEFTPLDAGDYLVHVDLGEKVDQQTPPKPIYKVTREEDINIGNGDQVVPQVPPPACAGALHTVDVAGIDDDGDLEFLADGVTPNPAFDGDGPNATDNPTFVDIGGSPYEGQARPLCDTKLVQLQNGKSVVPMFNVYTDVPLPGRFYGLTVDDLMATTDPKSLLYGEKAPLAFNPVGIYDAWNRLITTVETDYNGIYDVLLPSTNRINCPTPSGVCAGVYRTVGNDPGTPGHLNLNYNPAYRTIAADFEVFPGLIVPADTAPVPVGALLELPGTNQLALATCPVNATDVTAANRIPELYAVSRPYVTGSVPSFTIFGKGFGATQGTGQLTLDGSPSGITISSWTDTEIKVSSTSSSVGFGPHQLMVTASNGKSIVNGLTFYKIGGSYNPVVYEVGPNDNLNRVLPKPSTWRWFTPQETLPVTADHAIQDALDAIPASNNSGTSIVVVYPNKPTANPRQNPRGAYYENLIITKRVKLQGVGPGAPDGSVPGSIVDGGAFGGDSPVATDWYTRMNTATWAGNQDVFDGAVISLYLPNSGNNAFPTSFSATTAPAIDGLDLRGGDQLGFPGNLGDLLGVPGEAGVGVTQGGAIFANAYARNLQITNNVVQNNGGTYGTIRIGTPDLASPDNQNDAVRIMNNRIVSNGGTNLAGGVGIFAGADGYVVRGNDICGNFSSEYGGGLTVYGLSPNGSIDHNRVYDNQSYDEGGGIMIAGQLPTDPSILSPGSGAQSIHDNLIQSNLANDDGGGLRFLMASSDCDGNLTNTTYRPCAINVYNNFLVDNVSAHEGGGIALDDAPNVRIYNNTVMKNVTTATAVTSDGSPAPAGLSTGQNSSLLQARLNATYTSPPTFSNPLLFNDIFWDNRAGSRVAGTVVGIGASGDATPINRWDLGTADGTGTLTITDSVIQQDNGVHAFNGSNNDQADPLAVDPYDVSLAFAPWRTNPNFTGAIIVGLDVPPKLLGDYHLQGVVSSASNQGVPTKAVPTYQGGGTLAAPQTDYDAQIRSTIHPEAGADEIPAPLANLSITKTDGVATVQPGGTLTYTIVVANAGPAQVTAAQVTDTFPSGLTVNSWTCAPAAKCTAGGSGSARTGTVTLLAGDSATFTAQVTLAASATPGSLANAATVAIAPADDPVDPDATNNTATDTDQIVLPRPTLTVLDNFDRTDASTLNTALTPWVQATNIGVSGNTARSTNTQTTPPPLALWAGTGTPFGATQGAAVKFVQAGSPLSPTAPVSNTALILKANGTTANPSSYLRVLYDTGGGRVVVAYTTNSGGSFSTLNATAGSFNTGTWAIGDTLTAVANANGTVDVWRNTTYLGRSAAAPSPTFTGTGRIGMRLPNNSRVDDFSGQSLP
jgi:uncharacterized repeat protein (TIGR01451 family)